MTRNDNPVSLEVWENIFNDPNRKAEGDKRAEEEAVLRKGKQEILTDFHQKCAKRRKVRIEAQAFRHTVAGVAAGAVALFVGCGGIGWLAWVLGVAGVVLCLVGSYGFGCAYEARR